MNKTFTILASAATLVLATSQAQAVGCDNDYTGGSPTAPNDRYLDNGDRTVTDNDTGLMWMKCAAGKTADNCLSNTLYTGGTLDLHPGGALKLNWEASLAYANEVNTVYAANTDANPGGHTDWRLPNAKELESLVERCRTQPAINTLFFTVNTPKSSQAGKYWTSTPAHRPDAGQANADVPFHAWAIDFQSGNDWREHKSNKFFYLRLVRTAD